MPRKFIAKKRRPCVRGKIPITQDAVVKDRFESCPACGRNSDRILTVSLRNIAVVDGEMQQIKWHVGGGRQRKWLLQLFNLNASKLW